MPANRKAKLSSSETSDQGAPFYDTSSSATIGLTLNVSPTPEPPAELRQRDQWVSWKYEHNPKNPEHPRKPPVNATGRRIDVTDPDNHLSWKDARRQARYHKLDGIGFVFTSDDPFCGVDIDNCREPETGAVQAWAVQIIKKINSYAEVSPSRTGVKIWLKGKKPAGPNKWHPFPGDKDRAIEVYDCARYFAFTGQALDGYTTVRDAQEALEALCACALPETTERTAAPVGKPRNRDVSDTKILQRIESERPDRYTKLFEAGADESDNGSDLDFELACLLAEQVGNDPERIEDLMYQSALVRDDPDSDDKWVRHHTYLAQTIAKAIKRVAANAASPCLNPPKYWNDITTAREFAEQARDTLRYCHAWRTWLAWDGRRWARDHEMRVQERLKEYVLEMLSIAAKERDDTRRKELMQIFSAYTRQGRLKDLELLARSTLVITPGELDTSPWLLNVLNGTLDLATTCVNAGGTLHVALLPHDPEQLLTKLAPVTYTPGITSTRWHTFLTIALRRNAEINWDDPLATAEADHELVRYAQELAGLSLTGDVRDDTLIFAHGPGGSGKTTFMGTLQHLLGGYAVAIDFDTLLRQPSGRASEAHRDLARLAGTRAAFASEVAEERRWDLGTVKQLTGGDIQRGRRLYSEAFEFEPTAKIWCRANEKPAAYDPTDALWRRMRLLPFEHATPSGRRDKTLRDALLEGMELTGILNWALVGLARWLQRGGLPSEKELPVRVRAATDAYRAEQVDDDPLAPFFETCCIIKPKKESLWTSSAALYAAMERWWYEQGRPRPTPSPKRLAQALALYGVTTKKVGRDASTNNKQQRGWCGIKLRETIIVRP